jgi:hypothetical protein
MPLVVMASCIELWCLDRLIPKARNARTRTEEHVAQDRCIYRNKNSDWRIRSSSAAAGIIAGHGRPLVARKLSGTSWRTGSAAPARR